ncbi:Acetyl-CoA carboxylase 2 [Camellia lanceoleosa]|uniref:Acetyl-CoA carboxylase 2 n=1 Tax=Camellia lanceoleosa TaxID=1840588 RepID=A0ACC0IXL7_9ERIC|nr:Acetyl-CoA carboxylase 2 [Camellia lanceoleosa]
MVEKSDMSSVSSSSSSPKTQITNTVKCDTKEESVEKMKCPAISQDLEGNVSQRTSTVESNQGRCSAIEESLSSSTEKANCEQHSELGSIQNCNDLTTDDHSSSSLSKLEKENNSEENNEQAQDGDEVDNSLALVPAEVPTLRWSGSHVKIPPKSCLVTIPDDTYRKACVYTTEEAISSCQVVGHPAMVKASWGGGGKGIRKVHNDDEVRALFKQVQGEVPGSPIFIMKLASLSRHLEVLLLCDQYGNVAALHSRDCSVQRRHQKIIEEGTITVAPLETVKKLEQAARRLAKCVNYVGAATVEYLYSMDTGEYYFLELNPRLQCCVGVLELSLSNTPSQNDLSTMLFTRGRFFPWLSYQQYFKWACGQHG